MTVFGVSKAFVTERLTSSAMCTEAVSDALVLVGA